MPYTVPESELTFQASRSSGPGGQHVNKASTRIEAIWDVSESPSLTEEQRARIFRKLGKRIDGRGRLRVASEEYRSQSWNRKAAIERIQELVTEALRLPKPRRATKPSRAAVERRLQEKREQSRKKEGRGAPHPDD